jgi:type VI protein secretion system component VasF
MFAVRARRGPTPDPEEHQMSLLDKAKETAKKAGDKAKELGQAGQEKFDSMKAEKKVNDLKEELGGIVYAQRSGNAPENAEAEIDRIVGEIAETEAGIAAAAEADADDAAPAPDAGTDS